MVKIRKSEDRGQVNHGWLKAKHTFSFGSYRDPQHQHFGPLLVINQDKIAGGAGFPEHPHDNMEIITYIIKGELSHKDNTGGISTIYPGKIQRMSAGTGIRHSEYNSSREETELLQIWIIPEEKGLEPGYEEKEFDSALAQNELQVLAGKSSEALNINRDILLYRSFLDEKLSYKTRKKRQWLQLISGSVSVNGNVLNQGDAIGLTETKEMEIIPAEKAHFLLFDMN